MARFLHATICAGLVVLGGCGKTDIKTAANEPTALSKSPQAPLPLPVVEAAQPKIQAKTYGGPFGLAMGIQIKELVDNLGFKHESEDLYSGTPPKLTPGFDTYYVTATPAGGICKVAAIVKVTNISGSGSQLKAAADEIAEMVELKYGKPTKKYDFASQDFYKRNPDYWMSGLRKQDVSYLYLWTKSKTLDLPNDIENIEVMPVGTSGDGGYVRLLYAFSNDKACDEEIKRKKSTNL